MKFIFSRRVANYDQIARRWFPGVHIKTVRRRIQALKDQGFLRMEGSVKERIAQPYFLLEPKAWPLIREEWAFEIDHPQFRSDSPNHDLGATEIVFQLEKLRQHCGFFSENLLQCSSVLVNEEKIGALSRLQADGALIIKTDSGAKLVFGFEYEISKKTPARYQEKLTAYYLANEVSGVIYICGDMQILNAVAKADELVRENGKSKLYFSLEKIVMTATKEMFFQNAKIDGIRLQMGCFPPAVRTAGEQTLSV